jgi:hypothetical protein
MRRLLCLATVMIALPAGVPAQPAEKQLVVTITSEQLKGGVVSELTWDGNMLVIQGVFAKPSGELDAQYFVKPAQNVELQHRASHTAASARYWTMKSRRLSPTGLGELTVRKDEKMPMYGIASQEQRMYDAAQMGGTQMRHTVTLGTLLLHERVGPEPPYDGEVWSWSPPELNRVAYVNKNGDLWIAHADGRDPHRLLKGNFTLPAWSDDGQLIAVAERKDGGRRWEISVVTIPPRLLR